MKFLQIKPLCQATANYLTDWPPSGSGYSVKWPFLSCPPPSPSNTAPPALSSSFSAERGRFEKIPEGLILFKRLYILYPPFPFSFFSSQTSIHPQPGKCGVCGHLLMWGQSGGCVCQSFQIQKYLILRSKIKNIMTLGEIEI